MKYWQIKHTGWFHPSFELFNLFVLLVRFQTFGLNLPVCSICQYLMSGSKLGLNHPVCSICQYKFWTRHEEQTSWTYRVIPSKSFEPDMKYWQIEHTGWFNPSFEPDMKYWQTCQCLMSGTKLLDEITLYVQLVCSSCPIPNFWIESSCLFNLSVLVWFKTSYRKIPSESFEPDKLNIHGDSIQVLNQTWRTDKLNIKGDSIQKFWTRHEVLLDWITLYV
jgi:hypothetical protein